MSHALVDERIAPPRARSAQPRLAATSCRCVLALTLDSWGGLSSHSCERAEPSDSVITLVRKVRYDAFYGTPLDHLLRVWNIGTLVICGTVANICVHYTTAGAAIRWYDVVIPRDAVSALEPFDLESSLRQTAFVFGGWITTTDRVRIEKDATEND